MKGKQEGELASKEENHGGGIDNLGGGGVGGEGEFKAEHREN